MWCQHNTRCNIPIPINHNSEDAVMSQNTYEKMQEEGLLKFVDSPEKEAEARLTVTFLESLLNLCEEHIKASSLGTTLKSMDAVKEMLTVKHGASVILEMLAKLEKELKKKEEAK